MNNGRVDEQRQHKVNQVERFDRLLAGLISSKELHKVASQRGFLDEIATVSRYASEAPGVEKLCAISLLCKVGVLVRSSRLEIERELAGLLNDEPVALSRLTNPNDRYYAAMFWRFHRPSWSRRFLAESMSREESAENAREELALGLVVIAGTFSAAVDELTVAFQNLRFDTEKPGVSLARRMRRCIESLREALGDPEVCDPGSNFGGALRNLARLISGPSASKTETKAFQEAAESLVRFLNGIVRMRLRAAFESEAFTIFYTLRDWFDPGSWCEFIETKTVQASKRDLVDSLEILARSGRSDRELLPILKLISPDEEAVSTEIRGILERNIGLAPEVISWLTGTPVIEQSSHSEANEVLRLEAGIARLMVGAENLRASVVDGRSSPGNLHQVQRLISELASERRLQLFGNPGTVVAYSALEHETASAEALGTRSVVIKRQGVVGRTTDGRRRVVLKAIVEKP